jgi:hypothetical protein
MRPFGGRHHRVAGLIRKGDIAGEGATFLVAAAIMRLTPFVKASRQLSAKEIRICCFLLFVERKDIYGDCFCVSQIKIMARFYR